MPLLAGTYHRVIALLPGVEGRDSAGDAFLADLHAAPDAEILQESRADEVLAARDDPGGGPAQELVGAVDRNVGTRREEPPEVVLGGEISDHRHAPGVADCGEFRDRD